MTRSSGADLRRLLRLVDEVKSSTTVVVPPWARGWLRRRIRVGQTWRYDAQIFESPIDFLRIEVFATRDAELVVQLSTAPGDRIALIRLQDRP